MIAYVIVCVSGPCKFVSAFRRLKDAEQERDQMNEEKLCSRSHRIVKMSPLAATEKRT